MPIDGWHALPDGREGFHRDGLCVAAIRHDPQGDPPYRTESIAQDGTRSLRNFDTVSAAKDHCQWFTGVAAAEHAPSTAIRPEIRADPVASPREPD